MMALHNCTPGYDFDKDKRIFPSGGGWGPAIDDCKEDERGHRWPRNSEHGTQVNFCPFYGYRARAQIEWPTHNQVIYPLRIGDTPGGVMIYKRSWCAVHVLICDEEGNAT